MGSPHGARPTNALKQHGHELRVRSGRLREDSRTLLSRARECRRVVRVTAVRAAAIVEVRPAELPAARQEQLVQVESELVKAIEECRDALAVVRGEMGWAGGPTAPRVH